MRDNPNETYRYGLRIRCARLLVLRLRQSISLALLLQRLTGSSTPGCNLRLVGVAAPKTLDARSRVAAPAPSTTSSSSSSMTRTLDFWGFFLGVLGFTIFFSRLGSWTNVTVSLTFLSELQLASCSPSRAKMRLSDRLRMVLLVSS